MEEKDIFDTAEEPIPAPSPPVAEFTPPEPPKALPPAVEPGVVPKTESNIYNVSERRNLENQDVAANIFSIMDENDRRLLMFFSNKHLRKQILLSGELNANKLSMYFDETPERIGQRIRMMVDIGAIFFDDENLPVANTKVAQFVATVAPTY